MQQCETCHAACTCLLLAEERFFPLLSTMVYCFFSLLRADLASVSCLVLLVLCSFFFFLVHFLCIPGKIRTLAFYITNAFLFSPSLQDKFHILLQPTWMFLCGDLVNFPTILLISCPLFIAFVSFFQSACLVCVSLSDPHDFFALVSWMLSIFLLSIEVAKHFPGIFRLDTI